MIVTGGLMLMLIFYKVFERKTMDSKYIVQLKAIHQEKEDHIYFLETKLAKLETEILHLKSENKRLHDILIMFKNLIK